MMSAESEAIIAASAISRNDVPWTGTWHVRGLLMNATSRPRLEPLSPDVCESTHRARHSRAVGSRLFYNWK